MNKNDSVFQIMSHMSNRWQNYVSIGTVEAFVEFTLILARLNDLFAHQHLPGLLHLCQSLESLAFTKLGEETSHPLNAYELAILDRQIQTLISAATSLATTPKEKRIENPTIGANQNWVKQRSVWLCIDNQLEKLSKYLHYQLKFFGFQSEILNCSIGDSQSRNPTAIVFSEKSLTSEAFLNISTIRKKCPTSHLIYIGVEDDINLIVELLRAGIDKIIPQNEGTYGVLDYILNLVQISQTEKSKVLIVEDSKVAVEMINRALLPQQIDTHSINNPIYLIKALNEFQPDLVLMDMHMPGFNGVEATRVLRQFSFYTSIPVVYLSGESDIGMQVEALRLGGDQFLTKPFDPILFTAIVKTKIERYHEIQRSTQIDGLTGLLNHAAAKSKLEQAITVKENEDLSVVMLDIDHFKSINDVYGHPVGDEVIRGLAWLLKGRLRGTDIIGRYGGEEFLIVLKGANLEHAKTIIEKIRKDFAEFSISHANAELRASFSAGIASYANFKNSRLLIEAADNALLNAKKLGRNRIELARNIPE